MAKYPLTRCCSSKREQLQKAEDYGHDNLGENPPHFDFSIIDYSAMAEDQVSGLGGEGVWTFNET